ncbi:hypothetical protein GALMADRAFT_235459 [Galerina marginata CBS 339.88]|uniref:Deacetylase sirtuin-type domain-containing protein n=1 Tax=Galerina marginata (strain CBS 339.88) TaxID=685588 RepID=A0A067TWG2_GALM3|nr:hypothetical protein GALMADRAFT_235459 [Galerina marginata CBS 339.88]
MAPSEDMDNFRALLRSSKHIIAVAGAGLSAASGIPTFRGAGGMWRKYDAISLATPEGFAESPSLVWQFYHYRRETLVSSFQCHSLMFIAVQSTARAQPNNAHRALSAFSLTSVRNQITPNSSFTLVTQNVDGLSPRANREITANHPEYTQNAPGGDPQLIEMHGRLFDVLCNSNGCGYVEFNTASPVCEALAGTEQLVEDNTLDPDIDPKSLPRCPSAGHLLDQVLSGSGRFHITWTV